jgi:hypothetical protein
MSFIIVELSNSTSAKEQLKGIEMREVDIYTIVALTKRLLTLLFLGKTPLKAYRYAPALRVVTPAGSNCVYP